MKKPVDIIRKYRVLQGELDFLNEEDSAFDSLDGDSQLEYLIRLNIFKLDIMLAYLRCNIFI